MVNDEIILTGKKLLFARLAWWFVFLAHGTFSIFSHWHYYMHWGKEYFTLDTYLRLGGNIFGYILAILGLFPNRVKVRVNSRGQRKEQ